jgi:predicted TIM-barrel enzyme
MKHSVYPVVHHTDHPTTLSQARLALRLGADGVFLISHGGRDCDLVPLAHTLMAEYPDKLIGLNFLSLDAGTALAWCIREGFKLLWVDDAGVTSDGATLEGQAFARAGAEHGLTLFASVAFKYQKPDANPGEAARQAIALGMVPTTSGAGTGHAPEVAKIATMRSVLAPTDRLALASGMTVDNLHAFLPHATDFLVATGVSQDMHHFDPQLLEQFIDLTHAGQ